MHQSTVVQPHWFVVAEREGRWTLTMQLTMDTSRAENRIAERIAAAAVG